jgi:hypothetical protein
VIRLFAIFAILMTLCGCGSGATPTHVHYLPSIEPVRWQQPEILYRVAGPTGDARRAVRRGFGRWETAIQDFIRLREAQDGEREHITARFASIAPLFRDGRLERVTPKSERGVMSSALVEFDYQLALPQRLGDLERFASHAMGHCLFAQGQRTGGHSPYSTDVMYASPGVARPSAQDIRTLHLAWGGDSTVRKYRGASQSTTTPERERDTLPSRATRVVEDEDLLREVLRRACLINPELVKAALEDGEARVNAIQDGGYMKQFGENG